ncbi:MAG: hypothetical protein SGARI_004993, partial [Bacillariaceae sp.]
EATRALIVSKAFQRQTEGSSMVQAIQNLVSNISLNNLLYESDSSMDVASDDEEESLTLAVRSDLRVNPVAKVNTQQHSITKTETVSASLSGRKRKIHAAATDRDINDRVPKKTTKHEHVSKPLGKRKADAATNEKPTNSRPRADSVTEVVDAKITAALPATSAAAAASRPKRHLRSGSPEDALLSEGAVSSEPASPPEQRE